MGLYYENTTYTTIPHNQNYNHIPYWYIRITAHFPYVHLNKMYMLAMVFCVPHRRWNIRIRLRVRLVTPLPWDGDDGETTEFIRCNLWVVAIISQQSFRWPENPERKQYMKSLYKTLIISTKTQLFEILIEFIAFYDRAHHHILFYIKLRYASRTLI